MRPKMSYPQTLGHKQVAMLVIGRTIRDYEVVHHIDEDHSNDDPDNLLVLPKTTHFLIHCGKAPRWMRDAFSWLAPEAPGPYAAANRRHLRKWLDCNPWAFAWLCPESEFSNTLIIE